MTQIDNPFLGTIARVMAPPKSRKPSYNTRGYYERKKIVLTYYGQGKLACIVCGFDNSDALSIDHINGGGHQHAKGRIPREIYAWLIKNDFPVGFRTLCMNCQWIAKARMKLTRKKKNARLHRFEPNGHFDK